MKRFILPIILLLTVAFFSPQKVNAQTDSECFKDYQKKEYKCLQTRTKCIQSCSSINNLKACHDSCSAQDKTCSEQASADLTACKAAIKKDNKNPTETKESPEVETNTDCHGAFTKESNSCLKESTKCLSSCVDKANAAMSLTVDGGKVMDECVKNVCNPAFEACNNKATANFRACGKSDNQPKEAKQEAPKQETNWLEFLGINPYQTWLRLQEIAEVTEFYASGDLEESLQRAFTNPFGAKTVRQKDEETVKAQELAFESVFGKDWREQIQQLNEPKIDTKVETDAWSVPAPKVESVINVPGTTDTKRYSWDENSGAVVKSNDWEKIKFREPVAVEGFTSHTVELGQGEIEVKVRNNKPAENQFGVDAGWLGVTVSRTHFWVSKSQDKKMAVIGVYEGEVEVKTKDGKVVKVKPEGDKPGLVLVTSKLSTTKLALSGLMLVGIIGGIIFLLKRKKKK